MTNEAKRRVRQSFIVGSLTSSAGVFLSKAIGLFYVVPFTAIATEDNMVFYNDAYTYYNVLLQICSAGLPFAIASIIAKYAGRDDYKTVLLVRKLSTFLLSAAGLVMALVFALVSVPLSRSALGPEATALDITRMSVTFRILSLALFFVPLLYSYRSFYQGFKDLKAYADSQVIEQFARVAALLGMGSLAVYALKLDRIWSIYMAVLATSIGALTALAYYVHYDRRHIGPIRRAARAQKSAPMKGGDILKELLAFGIPYLIVAFFGNSQALINTQYFMPVTTGLGLDYEKAKIIKSIINLQCDKLTSIPQVLGIGFSAGIVPYMTVALDKRDMNELHKYIRECLDTVLYIGIPVCFCMLVLARPIYYIMYGGRYLDLGEECLMYSSMLGLCTTITPICSSMMMTLHLRKESIFYLGVGFAVKCITFYPLIRYTGYTGSITSSILCSATIIYLCLAKIKNKFDVEYAATGKRMLKMILCCICMNGIFAIFRLLGFGFSETSRTTALLQLAAYGLAGMIVYFYTTSLMKIPQAIFHMSFSEGIRKILGKGRRA
ncbi:MAG: polysaccharide biosynthesis C-terminal domain-containing protein [Solobacterium sp.]|nr:polysaccharide biosynthesis C-terminal domain-containing protein [Solobacterium sp.]